MSRKKKETIAATEELDTTKMAEGVEVIAEELEVVEEPEEVKVDKSKEKNIQVYVGPSLMNIVRTNTVFSNGLPSNLQKVIDDNPFMKSLVVDLSDFAKALRDVNTEGSAMNVIYEKANKI